MPVIVPTAAPEKIVALGRSNCGVLKTLKNSVRNWILTCSVIGKSLNREKSKFTRPGPSRMLRPALPY